MGRNFLSGKGVACIGRRGRLTRSDETYGMTSDFASAAGCGITVSSGRNLRRAIDTGIG